MNPDWARASEAGDLDALKRLAREGCDINALDGHNQTALMRAAHAGHVHVVAWLIEQSADLDRTAKFGLSALMLAIVGRRAEVARLLVDAGANLTIRGTGAPGFSGKTAADLAEESGDTSLAACIRSRMA